MKRRSKFSVSVKHRRDVTLPSFTKGRSFTMPKEMPRAHVHVAVMHSAPYFAGELMRTAPPRYFTHSDGNLSGSMIRNVESQMGNRVISVENSRHCLIWLASPVASLCSDSVMAASDVCPTSRIT